MDYRSKNKKKFNFAEKKKCALKSLKEINCFLCNLNKAYTIKKIIKK